MNLPSDNNEQKRLASLKDLEALDTPPDPAIERICRLVEFSFDCDTVLVSLVDECRQWFKRKSGVVEVDETPLDWSFCTHTIQSEDLFEVVDATKDPHFCKSPLVTGPPYIQYYAGVPLRLRDSTSPGSLCLIDIKPRAPLSDLQKDMFKEFAAIVSRELEMNRALRQALLQLSTLSK